jgi:hypothetical protein
MVLHKSTVVLLIEIHGKGGEYPPDDTNEGGGGITIFPFSALCSNNTEISGKVIASRIQLL